jgi:hypothetical protein
MSGRCCLGHDDGNGILRAANPGVAVTGITQRFSPAPFLGRPDRRRAIPSSKGAQNAQIGAISALIDVEHVRKQIGGSTGVLSPVHNSAP